MKIIGPDYLVFGVDNVDACVQYLTDYGLKPGKLDEAGGYLEALDGTGIEIRHRDDPRLPKAMETANTLRAHAMPDRKLEEALVRCCKQGALSFS